MNYFRKYENGDETLVTESAETPGQYLVHTKSATPAPPFTDDEGWQFQRTLWSAKEASEYAAKHGLS